MSSANVKALSVLAFVAAPLFVAGALRFGHDPVAHEAAASFIHRDGGYVGSSTCRACHPDHFDSWRATFHSTMTQRPSPAAIQGIFDGRSVRYEGAEARPFREGDRFFMDLPTAQGGRRRAEVALLVGSRRYQQYFEVEHRGDTDAFVRLPILWHRGARRWLHLNTVFLHPDDPNWDGHKSTWNENCIFCHNTGPEPRMLNYADASRLAGNKFDSRVGEFGIACEACHGPGAAHSDARRDPVARYALHASKPVDPTIVNPARLDKERAVSSCGQCHGQRLPEPIERISAWMTTGPTFRAGDKLTDHVSPITQSTPVRGSSDQDLFRVRFWPDGTPRLTAYEFQGVTSSPCYLRGPMTCQSCHAMHAGDPHGQLRPDLPGNQICTQCHERYAADVTAHTHHAPQSSGSSCVECHMPRMVYGIVEIHRSHRIESPEPKRDADAGRPHACTLCHLDRPLTWVAERMNAFWGNHYELPTSRRDRAPSALPDAAASLLSGDAVQRAVYAAALGRSGASFDPAFGAGLRAWLAITMGDGYPSIRWIAQRSLQSLEERVPIGLRDVLSRIDHTEGPEARRRAVFSVLDAIAERAPGRLARPAPGTFVGQDFRVDLRQIVNLTNLQGQNPISIGE